MPRIGVGKSPKTIAQQQAAAQKTFNDSANARASQVGITLPANFYQLSLNQSQKSAGIAKYTGANYVDSYASNKSSFLQNAVKNATYDYAWLAYGRTTPDAGAETRLKNAVTAAAQGGVPVSSINSSVDAGKNAWGSYIGGAESAIDRIAGYAAPIAMAYFLPQIGSSLGSALLNSGVITSTATANAVGTALASISVQTAQGVPFEDALKNATVNAVVSTGAPSVATEINNIVKIPAVSDAIVSAGASALKTVATGGSAEDMQKNILGAIAGSAAASATDNRVVGSTVGGAVTGGTAGALSGAAGEYAAQSAEQQAATQAQKGSQLASADTGIVSDVSSLSPVIVTPKKTTIQDTNIIAPTTTPSPTTTQTTPNINQQILDLIKQPATDKSTPSLSEIKVVATRPKETTIQDTNIITPETLPETFVTASPESPLPVNIEEQPGTGDSTPADKYKPSLFIYGGTTKSTLPKTLSTGATFAAPTTGTTTGTTTGLTGERGAGEIESKETGKKRKNVWNEASLRLKDALGV